jgi:hypothetical protein
VCPCLRARRSSPGSGSLQAAVVCRVISETLAHPVEVVLLDRGPGPAAFVLALTIKGTSVEESKGWPQSFMGQLWRAPNEALGVAV